MYIEPEVFREQNSNYISGNIMPVIVFTYDEDFQQSNLSRMANKWKQLEKTFNPQKGRAKIKDFQSINPADINDIQSDNDFILSSEQFYIISEIQASELSKNNQKLLKDLEFGIRLLSSDFSELLLLNNYIDAERLAEAEIQDGTIDEVLEQFDTVFELIQRTQEIQRNRQEKERQEELEYERQKQEEQEQVSEDLDEDITMTIPDEEDNGDSESESEDDERYENELTEEEQALIDSESNYDEDYDYDEEAEDEYQGGDFLQDNLQKLKVNIDDITPITSVDFEGYDFEDDEFFEQYPVLKSIVYNGNINRLNRTTELNEELFDLRSDTVRKIYNLLGDKVEKQLESINKRTTVVSKNDVNNGFQKVNNPFQEKMDMLEEQGMNEREKLNKRRDSIQQRYEEEYEEQKRRYLEQQREIESVKFEQEHHHEIEEKTSAEYDSLAEELERQFIESQTILLQKADNEFIRLNNELVSFVLDTNKEEVQSIIDDYSEQCKQKVDNYNTTNKQEKEKIDKELKESVNEIIEREQDVDNRVKQRIEEGLASKEAEVAEIQRKNNELSQKYHNRESDIAHYQEQYKKGLKELQDWKEEVNKLKEENARLKEEYNVELEKRSQQLEQTNAEIANLSSIVNDKEEREKQTIEDKRNFETMRLNQQNNSRKWGFITAIASAVLLCGTALGIAVFNGRSNNQSDSQNQQIQMLQKQLDEQKDKNSQLENQVTQTSQEKELENTQKELEKAQNKLKSLEKDKTTSDSKEEK